MSDRADEPELRDTSASRPTLPAQPLRSNIAKQDVPQCPCCLSSRRTALMDVCEHEYDNTTDDVFTFWKCEDCAAWFLAPRPALSAFDVIYPPNYYAYATDSGSVSGLPDWLNERLFRARMPPYEENMHVAEGIRWLEIGCGQGEFLERLRRFYGVDGCVGIDLSERAVEICLRKGLDAHAVSFEDYEIPDGPGFDVVHSSHVIEHVASPREYVEKAFRLLRPGGLCVFDTPNTATWEARLFGPYWGALHVPRHWTLLDPESARKLGESVGFEWCDVFFYPSAAFWIWSLHHTLERFFGRKLADLLFPSDHRINDSGLAGIARMGAFTVFERFTIALARRSANMTVVLRKPNPEAA